MNYRSKIILSVLLCLATIWALALHDIQQDRDTALQQAGVETLIQARAYAEYSASTMKRLDEVLLDYRQHWRNSAKEFAQHVDVSQNNIRDIAFQIAVIDRDGHLAYSNLPGAELGMDLSDRQHFQVHKHAARDDALYISNPVKGRASGKWSIQFTRAIRRGETFQGVMVVSVAPEVFSSFGHSLDIGRYGSLAVVRNDGQLISRFPEYENFLGRYFKEEPFIQVNAPLSGGYTRVAATDQVERIYGYVKDPEFGFSYVVGQSAAEVLTPHEHHRRMVTWLAGASSLVVLVLFGLLWRSFQSAERLQQSLLAAKLRAEEANVAKSQFLANMSHEIRTPMNGVIGMTQLLMKTQLSAEQREYAKLIETSGESLLVLINDILDLSKIEAGHMEFELAPFALDALVQRIGRLMQVRADKKGIALVVEGLSDGGQMRLGDSLRIQQVLINLLGNAIKFTDHGEVRLQVADQGGVVRFEVRDTGIGIPDSAMQRLFSNFSQVDASTSRKYGGTGLGLVICKRMVEGMGGTIGVHSQVGVGSNFWFELPLAAVPAPVAGTQPPAVPEPDEAPVSGPAPLAPQPVATQVGDRVAPHGSRILLVEDHPINQKLALVLLGQFGFACDLAPNGQEGVDAAAAKDYDLILMDLQMPVMDGLQAASLIRRSGGRNAGTPIVAMTANVMPSDRESCIAVGMNDFISKPFSGAALAAIVEKWIAVEPASKRDDLINLLRARTIIEDTQDAIISKTLTGIITSWNRGAERLFGYTAQEAIGMPMLFVIPQDRKFEEDDFLRRVGSGERIDSFETVRQNKRGERIDVSVTLSPMRDAAGTIVGVSKIARDISDRKAAEVLRQAKERAEHAAQARADVMLSMSHELRTPLHHIVGFSDVLLEGGLSPELLQYAKSIKSAAQLLIEQLGKVLDSVDLAQGELQLDLAEFNVHGVLQAIQGEYAVQSAARGIDWSVRCAEGVRASCFGDVAKLRDVLGHLVDNAFKFTREGRIGLEVRQVDGFLEFAVADTGCGMSPAQMTQIFNPLTQLDQSMSRLHGGMGMGCALGEQLARLMGGFIRVESELGKGSLFVLRIPAWQPLSKLNILAVDDVALNLLLLRSMLGKQHTITCVDNGRAALQAMEQQAFDVVLMDVQMPEMDGLQTTRRIREMEISRNMPRTPIIAVTANTTEQDRQNALNAGMDDFVTKPVSRSLLVQSLERTRSVSGTLQKA